MGEAREASKATLQARKQVWVDFLHLFYYMDSHSFYGRIQQASSEYPEGISVTMKHLSDSSLSSYSLMPCTFL